MIDLFNNNEPAKPEEQTIGPKVTFVNNPRWLEPGQPHGYQVTDNGNSVYVKIVWSGW